MRKKQYEKTSNHNNSILISLSICALAGSQAKAEIIWTFTLNYTVNGGGSPTPPTFNYYYLGEQMQSPLGTGNNVFIVDDASAWSLTPNPPGGSTGTGQWISNDVLSGTATADFTYTFTYYHQYYLTVNSAYGSPTGAGWYNAGDSATFSVSTPATGTTGTQYLLTSWAGSGNGAYSGSNSSSIVTMDNPITETANWQTQYLVTFTQTGINSDAGTNTALTLCGSTYSWNALPSNVWVNSGTTFSWSSPVTGSLGEQFVYVSDSGLASTITG